MSDPSPIYRHWSVEYVLQQRPKWATLGQLVSGEESLPLARPDNEFLSILEELDIIGPVLTLQELLDVDVDALERLQ